MHTEYEATFWPIQPDAIREKLADSKATRMYEERLMRRKAFNLPEPLNSPHRWARVRDEGDSITMSVKDISGNRIEDQKESQITVNDFEEASNLLLILGCQEKAFQETRRELWQLDGVDITIDTWPFLQPFIETEGSNEADVRSVAEKLGMNWGEARFCAVSALYIETYDITEQRINNETPRLVFSDPNPFLSSH